MSLKKHESALTIEEQVNNLKSLNLIIKDEQLAKDFLNDISYFRFIKSFSIGLKPKNGNYYDNISFKQLEELYLFNAEFRQILFTQIEKVEINLRCRISNYFCLKYGVLGYKDSNNFSNRKYHTAFLNEISIEINRNKRVPFIYNISNIRIFGVLCCIKHLVKNDIHWTNFVKKLEKLFQQYSYVDKNTMGFPADWKDILLI